MSPRRIDANNTSRKATDVDEVLVVGPDGTPANFGGTGAASGQVQGAAADTADPLGNPVLGGALVDSAPTLKTTGKVLTLRANVRGGLYVSLLDASGNAMSWRSNLADGFTFLNAIPVASHSVLFNGATYDRQRSVATAPTGTSAADEPLWTTSDLIGARINVSASGNTVLVAAVASQTTRVHRLRLSPAASVVVQIKDGATVLEAFNYTTGDPAIILDFSSRPYYKTTANTALTINLSGAVQVDGRIEYVTSV